MDSVAVGSVGACVAAVDWGEVSVEGDDSSFFGYFSVRWDCMSVTHWRLLYGLGCIGRVNCKVMVMLTFFLSMRGIPELLRDGVLAPKMSRKLSLTGWPFAFWRFGIVFD